MFLILRLNGQDLARVKLPPDFRSSEEIQKLKLQFKDLLDTTGGAEEFWIECASSPVKDPSLLKREVSHND